MGVEYPDAIDMFVDPSRTFIGAKPRGAIVDHKTAGFDTAEECATYFATNTGKVTSHFVIGLDGSVVQCVSLDNGACANCCIMGAYDPYWTAYLPDPTNPRSLNLNLVTISIEHVDNHKDSNGNYDNQGVCPQAQINASLKLHRWLNQYYDMQPEDVKPHSSIDPVNRSHCPGNFPLEWIKANMVVKEVPLSPLSVFQSKAFDIQWHSQIPTLPLGTGIYNAWLTEKANGKPYSAPTSQEYHSIDWNGKPIVCQNFGSHWIEWRSDGTYNFYGI